jgi:hypothetical protein
MAAAVPLAILALGIGGEAKRQADSAAAAQESNRVAEKQEKKQEALLQEARLKTAREDFARRRDMERARFRMGQQNRQMAGAGGTIRTSPSGIRNTSDAFMMGLTSGY